MLNPTMRDIYDVPLSLSSIKNFDPSIGPERTIKLVEEFEQQDPRVTFLSTFPVSCFVKLLFARDRYHRSCQLRGYASRVGSRMEANISECS